MKQRLRKTDREVFILSYHHKYGNDVSAYDSEEAAAAGARSIIEEYCPGLDTGNISWAIDKFCELENEVINIEVHHILELEPDAIDEMKEALEHGQDQGGVGD